MITRDFNTTLLKSPVNREIAASVLQRVLQVGDPERSSEAIKERVRTYFETLKRNHARIVAGVMDTENRMRSRARRIARVSQRSKQHALERSCRSVLGAEPAFSFFCFGVSEMDRREVTHRWVKQQDAVVALLSAASASRVSKMSRWAARGSAWKEGRAAAAAAAAVAATPLFLSADRCLTLTHFLFPHVCVTQSSASSSAGVSLWASFHATRCASMLQPANRICRSCLYSRQSPSCTARCISFSAWQ